MLRSVDSGVLILQPKEKFPSRYPCQDSSSEAMVRSADSMSALMSQFLSLYQVNELEGHKLFTLNITFKTHYIKLQ